MKRLVAAIILGSAVVAGAAYFTVWQPKVAVYEREQEIEREPTADLEREQGTVRVNGFEADLSGVHFIGDQKVRIDGKHASLGTGTFMLDLASMTLDQAPAEVPVVLPESLENPVILYASEGYGRLIVDRSEDGGGLFHLRTDGTLYRISSNFKLVEGRDDIVLSADQTKLAYYVAESHQMATYDLVTGKRKVVSGALPDVLKEGFADHLSLSPQGGWFFIEMPGETMDQTRLSIYGADSGRLYYSDLQAVYPQWSPDDTCLGFFWNGPLDDVQAGIANTRVGYIKLSKKQIVYFDKVGGEQQAGQQLLWSQDGNKVSWLVAERDDQESWSYQAMHTYDRSADVLRQKKLTAPIPASHPFELEAYEAGWQVSGIPDAIGWLSQDGTVELIADVDPIQVFGQGSVDRLPAYGGVLYATGDTLYWTDYAQVAFVSHLEGVRWVKATQEERWVALGMQHDEENIRFIPINRSEL